MKSNPTKWCSRCESHKPVDDFYINKGVQSGLAVYCKPCEAEYKWGWRIEQLYGITKADYERMLEAQGGVCAICGGLDPKTGRRLSVDHDHETGEVRGLLCGPCNRGVGLLGDTREKVQRVVTYLLEREGDE